MKFYNITDNVRVVDYVLSVSVTEDSRTIWTRPLFLYLELLFMFTFCLQDLPKQIRANFILNVETDELYITAGLQDRVVQVSDAVNTTHISVIFYLNPNF